MGRRGDGVRAQGDHAGPGHVLAHLFTGQMAADARLCALAHFDLDGRAGVEIPLVDAEAARGHLDDGVGAVGVEILVEAAFAGVVVNAEALRRPGQGEMGVVADSAVGHGGKQDRRFQPQGGRQIVDQTAAAVALHRHFPLSQIHPGLHRFAQRIDGGVRHLGGVDKQMIPVNGVGLRVAHGREQRAAAAGLTVKLLHRLHRPVGVGTILVAVFNDLQRMGRADAHAALAVHAVGAVAVHAVFLRVVAMHQIGALPLAGAALDTAAGVAQHFKFRGNVFLGQHQRPPPFTVTITPSPP